MGGVLFGEKRLGGEGRELMIVGGVRAKYITCAYIIVGEKKLNK